MEVMTFVSLGGYTPGWPTSETGEKIKNFCKKHPKAPQKYRF